MQNVLSFIEFALSHADPKTVPKNAEIQFGVGTGGVWKYLWGAHGQICTQKLLDYEYDHYYKKNGWNRQEYESITKGWVDDGVRVTDCQGLLDAFLGNNINANSNYNGYCTEKGLIAEIKRPFVIGEAVFNGTATKKTHVGWVCGFLKGDPLVVEARGLKYGVVITRMSNRVWKYRGLMTKKFSYENVEPQPEPSHYIFLRNLRYGCVGDDVIQLKMLLKNAGYDRGITTNTASSRKFGSATRRLVKDYQRDNGLTVDGIAGSKTITSLGGIYR